MSPPDHADSPQEFLARLDHDLGYPELARMARRLDGIFSRWSAVSGGMGLHRVRVALVGNSTLSYVHGPLSVYLARYGIQCDCITGEFNNYRQELLDEGSVIYGYRPQVVVVLLDHRAVHRWPDTGDSPEKTRELASRQVDEWEVLWSKVHSVAGASIIQTNIALPCERIFGSTEARATWSRSGYLRELNRVMAERAPTYVGICDAEHLSGCLGKQAWFDEPTRFNTGQGFGFQALGLLSRHLAGMTAGLLGRSKKCLVLDLDNTLWGGVVGDAGVEGIALRRGDAAGEAFIEFQEYCRKLKERGVLLAVCSKNDPDVARIPFETHPETVLKLDDFSAFMANWDDKAANLVKIAAELNLGLDSFVFVDDNPAERALVRRFLPEVSVPEMPEDPALFGRAIDRKSYFEVWTVSPEDLARAGYYASDLKRKEMAGQVADLPEFLRSLQQVCASGPFDEINLQRIVQLINKTNQWNLTTRRMVEGEVRRLMSDPAYYTLWVRHRDRFGDSGLISILIARQDGDALEIEDWLMSCRVINRGVEDYVFHELIAEAGRRGVSFIRGTYRPTPRNRMVSGLYGDLGFECVAGDDTGPTRWELRLTRDVRERPCYIDREE
jgi:FkbH-like protein